MKPRLRSFWSSASLLAVLLAAPVAGRTLQAASRVTAADLQGALLLVSINGALTGEPVLLLRGANSTFYAPSDIIKSWRLKHDLEPVFEHEGRQFYLLNAIAGLKLELAEESQSLTISAPPEKLELTRLAYAPVELHDRVVSGTGGFLNYDVSGQLADGLATMGGAFEAGVFTDKGAGVAAFIGHLSPGRAEIIRLDASWTIDDPARMRSLRFGDSVSKGGVGGGPVRFGGIQLARNFAVQPGFVTIPLPSIRGSAALPSVVDVYVNDALRDSRDVQPGPFEITDVPIVTGNGDVHLVVRDLLGREMLYSQSYYAAPKLLRKGLHDYSFEAGFLRRSFGLKSNDYRSMMVSTTHRYGISDRLTGEVHAEVTKDMQMAGIASSIAVPGIGHAEASIAASRSKMGEGALAGISLERQTRGLSLGAKAEFTTDDYMALGWTFERRPPASTIQAFAGVPMDFGSLGLSYLRRDGRGEPDVEYLSANSSLRLGRLGSLHLAGRKSLKGDKDLAAEVFLVLPLGSQSNATSGASFNAGAMNLNSSVQRNLPIGQGFGYRLATTMGKVDRIEGKLSFQTSFGVHDAQLTWTDHKSGVRLSTSGGIGIVGGDVFASRQLTQSFARVKVGEYPNVRVYADNQLVGRTNGRGVVVVPRLRPFDRNKIRIDLADVPWDAEVANDERTVRPHNRHGVTVDFAAAPLRAALITVLLENGSPLPAGSTIRLDGGPTEFVSAPGGEIYLTGLKTENSAIASWSNGSCRFQFRFTESGEPQPRLGDTTCRTMIQ